MIEAATTSTAANLVPAAALRHIPGTSSLLEVVRLRLDPLGFLRERRARYGPVFRTTLVFPVVFLIGPEANRTLHVTRRALFSYRRGFAPTAFKQIFDGSLMTQDGDEHEHDRRILQPAMARLALEGAFEEVQAIWEQAAARVARQTVDAYQLLQRITFEVSARVLLGLDLEEQIETFRLLFTRLARGVVVSLPWRIPFGALDRGVRAREQLCALLEPHIERSRLRPPRGMLGLLSHHRDEDGTPLTARRIAEHLLLLFWAGYDTTASTGAWALHELARAPAWQARLAAELPPTGRKPPTFDRLGRLAEMGWVLKEIERLRPAGIMFPRGTTQAVDVCGHHIPEGTLVFYSPYATHREESLYPEPHAFRPERWNPGGGRAEAAHALVGFGGGPRICLGKAFALMQLRVMLAALLGRYHLIAEDPRGATAEPLPVYRPRDSSVRFHPRQA